MRRAIRVAILLPLIPVLLAAAPGAEGQEVVPVGSALFSDPADYVFDGDYLYVIYPAGFGVADVSSPYEPRLLFEHSLPGEGKGIVLHESVLYMSCGTGGLVTADVSDPQAPVLLDTVAAPFSFGPVAINKGRLLAADERNGLLIYELTVPGSPQLLSSTDTGVEILDLATGGGVAYLATELSGLLLADVSTWQGSLLPGLPSLGAATAFALSGDTLFAALADSTVRAVDVADSSAPALLAGSYAAPFGLRAVAGLDSLLAVAGGDSVLLLRKADLAGGPVGGTAEIDEPGRIVAEEGRIGVASPSEGLVLCDLVLPQTTALIARFLPGDLQVQAVAVRGDTAFLGTQTGGVVLASVAEPAVTESLGVIETDGYVVDCEASGEVLYALEDVDVEGGLRIYDVPTGGRHGSILLPGVLGEMTRKDSAIYVTAADRGVYVVDVSDTAAPALVDSLPSGTTAGRIVQSVDISGDRGVVADGFSGLRIIDLSDPFHPSELGSFDTADFVSDAAWGEEGRIYVALRNTGILVLNGADPSAVDSIGVVPFSSYFEKPVLLLDLVRAGGYLYVTGYGGVGGRGDVHVLSLADPDDPEYLKAVESSANPLDIRVEGSTAHVAAGAGGYERYGLFSDFGLVARGAYRPYPQVVLASASDSRVLVADGAGGIWPLVVVGGESLAVGDRYDMGGPVNDLIVDERRAFIAPSGENRLGVFEIPLNTEVSFSGWVDLDAPAEGLDLADTLLYVAQGEGGLAVFNVARTDTVTRVGSFLSEGSYDLGSARAYAVHVRNDVAYVVTRDRQASLFLFDVSDPALPEPLSTYGSNRRAFGVAAYGSYAYLTQRVVGMEVLNVQDPSNPFFVSERNDLLSARRMEIVNEAFFVARRDNGFTVLDLENPFNPETVYDEDTPGLTEDLALHSRYLILADGNSARVFLQDFANADQQAPSYTIGILPNPFVNAFVDFVAVSSEALVEAPQFRFTMGETDSVLSVFPLNTLEHIYHAGYRLSETGIGTIRVEGEDLAGNKSETNRGFSVSYLRGAKGGSIYDETGKVEVVLPAGPAAAEDYVLLLPFTPADGARGRNMPEPVAGPYRIALGELERPVTVRLHGPLPEEGEKAPVLWRLSGDDWVLAGAPSSGGAACPAGTLPGSGSFLFSLRGGAPAPFTVRLAPNRPNPFNPETTIRYYLSRSAPARLAVYDLSGRLVRVLVDDRRPAGWNEAVWNGENGLGRPAGSGVYFSRLDAAGRLATGKMILLR